MALTHLLTTFLLFCQAFHPVLAGEIAGIPDWAFIVGIVGGVIVLAVWVVLICYCAKCLCFKRPSRGHARAQVKRQQHTSQRQMLPTTNEDQDTGFSTMLGMTSNPLARQHLEDKAASLKRTREAWQPDDPTPSQHQVIPMREPDYLQPKMASSVSHNGVQQSTFLKPPGQEGHRPPSSSMTLPKPVLRASVKSSSAVPPASPGAPSQLSRPSVDRSQKVRTLPSSRSSSQGPKPLAEWNVSEVAAWVAKTGLELDVRAILSRMTGAQLSVLSKVDLLQMGVLNAVSRRRAIEVRDQLVESLKTQQVSKRSVYDSEIDGDPNDGMKRQTSTGREMSKELKEFLSKVELEEYGEVLAADGVDDIMTLREYEVEELKNLGMLGGHAKKLVAAVKQQQETEEKQKSMTKLLGVSLGAELEEAHQREVSHRQRLNEVKLKTHRKDGRLWEIERHKVHMGDLLGFGAFGDVHMATVEDLMPGTNSCSVAVKTLRQDASDDDKHDFLAEIQVMQEVNGHKNVLQLLGICTAEEPMLIILEYMKDGNLRHFLRAARPSPGQEEPNVTALQLLTYMRDTASGMEFLSRHHVVHRDLAARNVLVDGTRVAVSDFGLSRYLDEDYAYMVQNKKRKLPTKWLAPECMIFQVFTSRSDVWAFGVVMWETLMMGAVPYPGISTVELFIQLTQKQYRMPRPTCCSSQLYQIMLDCWSGKPEARPNFLELEERLTKMLGHAEKHIRQGGDFTQEYMSLPLDEDQDEAQERKILAELRKKKKNHKAYVNVMLNGGVAPIEEVQEGSLDHAYTSEDQSSGGYMNVPERSRTASSNTFRQGYVNVKLNHEVSESSTDQDVVQSKKSSPYMNLKPDQQQEQQKSEDPYVFHVPRGAKGSNTLPTPSQAPRERMSSTASTASMLVPPSEAPPRRESATSQRGSRKRKNSRKRSADITTPTSEEDPYAQFKPKNIPVEVEDFSDDEIGDAPGAARGKHTNDPDMEYEARNDLFEQMAALANEDEFDGFDQNAIPPVQVSDEHDDVIQKHHEPSNQQQSSPYMNLQQPVANQSSPYMNVQNPPQSSEGPYMNLQNQGQSRNGPYMNLPSDQKETQHYMSVPPPPLATPEENADSSDPSHETSANRSSNPYMNVPEQSSSSGYMNLKEKKESAYMQVPPPPLAQPSDDTPVPPEPSSDPTESPEPVDEFDRSNKGSAYMKLDRDKIRPSYMNVQEESSQASDASKPGYMNVNEVDTSTKSSAYSNVPPPRPASSTDGPSPSTLQPPGEEAPKRSQSKSNAYSNVPVTRQAYMNLQGFDGRSFQQEQSVSASFEALESEDDDHTLDFDDINDNEPANDGGYLTSLDASGYGQEDLYGEVNTTQVSPEKQSTSNDAGYLAFDTPAEEDIYGTPKDDSGRANRPTVSLGSNSAGYLTVDGDSSTTDGYLSINANPDADDETGYLSVSAEGSQLYEDVATSAEAPPANQNQFSYDDYEYDDNDTTHELSHDANDDDDDAMNLVEEDVQSTLPPPPPVPNRGTKPSVSDTDAPIDLPPPPTAQETIEIYGSDVMHQPPPPPPSEDLYDEVRHD